MSRRDFRSPGSLPPHVAVLPHRLAQLHDIVLWRELDSGELEVAIKDGERVERIRVHHDGATSASGTSRHHARRVEALGMAIIGAGALGVLFLVAVPRSDGWWWLGVSAFVLYALVAVVHAWANDVKVHLDRELGRAYEWNSPTDLDNWMPATAAQLTAVENLADDHGGAAHLADLTDGAVDVDTGWHTYTLDAAGHVVSRQRRNSFKRRESARDWREIRVREDPRD